MSTTAASVRIHVELSHFGVFPPDLRLHVGIERIPLTPHTGATLAHAIMTNRAIARMKRPSRITHFADVSLDLLPDHKITPYRVTYDHGNPAIKLRGLALLGTHIPASHLRRVRKSKADPANGPVVHAKLVYLCATPPNYYEALDVLADGDKVLTPFDAAATTCGYHPQLGSTFLPSAATLSDVHIQGSANMNALLNYAMTIRNQKAAWIGVVPVVDASNNPMTYGCDIPGAAGEPNAANEGDPVERYELSCESLYGPSGTDNGYQQAMPTAIQTASNDLTLQNQSWSVAQGTPTSPPVINSSPAIADDAPDATSVTWTATNKTGNNGLSLDASSIALDAGTFSVNVTNSYVRTLGAYVSIFNENEIVNLDNYGWSNVLNGTMAELETPTLKYIQPIHPETMVMGIPISSTSATVTFPWPLDPNTQLPVGTSATLYFGSLGGSGYQNPQCVLGGILTGIFQFGFPALFLVQGITGGSSFLTSLMSGNTTAMAIVAVAFAAVNGVAGFTASIGDATQFLTTFAGIVAGLIVSTALKAILSELLAYMTGMELVDSTSIVGLGMRALAITGYEMQLTETSTQVFSAPATLIYDIAQTCDIQATFSPDPKHGLPGDPSTAVWPALAATYQATLQYQGGTSTSTSGTMPSPWSGTPVDVDFGMQPAGGTIQVVVQVLAANGWLCGSWTSGWVDGSPPAGSGTVMVTGNITEMLAPLTADTTYGYGQSIVYDATAKAHVWSDSPPLATMTSLNTNVGVQAIGSLGDIDMLDITYDVAYSWTGFPLNPPLSGGNTQAPGQAGTFQSINVLKDPDLRLMTPANVVTAPFAVSYQKTGPAPSTAAGVAPPYNFYVDDSSGTPTLRLLDLSGAPGTLPIGPPALAWATFPDQSKSTIDQLVVHQSGVAIGLNRANSRIAIVTLLTEGVTPDSAAPVAQTCSGFGTRQGLMNSPVAMDIAPDGRILILEQGNLRVQAFDHFGNPAPSFDGALLFTAVAAQSILDSLNTGVVPAALQSAFQANNINYIFSIDPNVAQSLSVGTVAPAVTNAFAAPTGTATGIMLTPNAAVSVSPTASDDWLVNDTLCSNAYVISPTPAATSLNVYVSWLGATVTAIPGGTRWIIANASTATSYDLVLNGDTLSVYEYLSTFPLVQPANGDTPTYLDIAIDPTGSAYILYYTGSQPVASDYALQIYSQNGSLLAITPNPDFPSTGATFVGAGIAIDIWRNLFTLDYQMTSGPGGQAEPTISQWLPTPPVAQLDPATYEACFLTPNAANLALIKSGLGAAGSALPEGFSVNTVSEAGHWQIIGPPSFDVILSAGGSSTGLSLYVYASS
ncbi:MAG: hypothetical protein V4550_10110 [Gemmatimonadota bacterium]